jgi:hypothetical protein
MKMLISLNPCWGMRAKKHKFSDTKIQIFVAFAKFFAPNDVGGSREGKREPTVGKELSGRFGEQRDFRGGEKGELPETL